MNPFMSFTAAESTSKEALLTHSDSVIEKRIDEATAVAVAAASSFGSDDLMWRKGKNRSSNSNNKLD